MPSSNIAVDFRHPAGQVPVINRLQDADDYSLPNAGLQPGAVMVWNGSQWQASGLLSVTAEMFGAYGDNPISGGGGHDDTTAISNALTQLQNNGGGELLLAPYRHYQITTPLSFLGTPLAIRGYGSTLDWYGTNSNVAQPVTNATNVAPIVLSVATASTFFSVGDIVQVKSVGGNTNANGVWTVSAVDTVSVTLNNSSGNSNYTTGGTIQKCQSMLTLGFASGASSANKSNSMPFVLDGVRIRYQDGLSPSTGQTSGIIGLNWQNVYSGEIRGASLDGFAVNWLVQALATGCSTQRAFWRQMKNGLINAYILGSGSGGYVSELNTENGDWIYGTTGVASQHFKVETVNGGTACSGVRFRDVSIQNNDNTASWGNVYNGDHVVWDTCRFETAGHPSPACTLTFGATTTDCRVEKNTGPATDLAIVDNSTSNPGNYTLVGTDRPWKRLYVSTGAAGPNSSTSKTSLIGTGVGIATTQANLTLPTGFQSRGRELLIKARGWVTTDATTAAGYTIELDIGADTFTLATTNTLPTSLTNAQWNMEFYVVRRVIGTGAAGRISVQGWFDHMTVNQNAAGGSTVVRIPLVSVGGTADDSTLSANINLQATASQALANNFQCEQFEVWAC